MVSAVSGERDTFEIRHPDASLQVLNETNGFNILTSVRRWQMRTGQIDTWTGNPADVGPMYPFVGYEVPLFVVCVALWLAYTVWQMKHENAVYQDELDRSAEAAPSVSETEGEGRDS